MTLLIDNDDSFTYNVLHLLKRVANSPIVVKRWSEVNIEMIDSFSHIIFSPGPGLPSDFPIMSEILQRYDSSKSILGICLGHQAICEYYGGTLKNLPNVMHGVESRITCNPTSLLFKDINTMNVGRYHSWIIDTLPASLHITAYDESGLIMGVEHQSKKVYGVQFHPESYITKEGAIILQNFLHGVSK